tara:strand:- start:17230 stop:17589 length:360 start_codon:yes stop_codon:yes gene_type:complete
MIIGYARVSTDYQNLDARTAVGAGKLFADKISGSKRDRLELGKMLYQLRDGDVVTVTKYDRLAQTFWRSWERSGRVVPAFDLWPRTSTRQRRQAVWCFMFSHLSPSSSEREFQSGPRKG